MAAARRRATLETAQTSALYQALVAERGGEDSISAVEREVIVGFVEATQIPPRRRPTWPAPVPR